MKAQHLPDAAITQLRERMQERLEDFRATQASARKPLEVRVMEFVALAAMGASAAGFVMMFAQGLTLYDGFDVPPLWRWIDFSAR